MYTNLALCPIKNLWDPQECGRQFHRYAITGGRSPAQCGLGSRCTVRLHQRAFWLVDWSKAQRRYKEQKCIAPLFANYIAYKALRALESSSSSFDTVTREMLQEIVLRLFRLHCCLFARRTVHLKVESALIELDFENASSSSSAWMVRMH